jgi:hypothetical protein
MSALLPLLPMADSASVSAYAARWTLGCEMAMFDRQLAFDSAGQETRYEWIDLIGPLKMRDS